MPEISNIKFEQRVGNLIYKIPVQTWIEGASQFFRFEYNKGILEEVKAMKGARWNPDAKVWYIPVNEPRNMFQLQFLMGLNPYAPYDGELDESWVPKTRYHEKKGKVNLFRHQPNMATEMYFRHYKIIAGEMGTSKTLAAIICMERADNDFRRDNDGKPSEWWYVAPRSALSAVEREFRLWGCTVHPKMMTYESLVKTIKAWIPGSKAPLGVIFDESSKIKNETAQRSQCAKILADGIRDDWKEKGYVILMTGTPAPKSPVDWYSQCEIACPGFVREGDIHKFKKRLGIIIQKESMDGGVYPQLVTWKDDEKKCGRCGKLADDPIHNDEFCVVPDAHSHVTSINEVKTLYSRLQGLVSVYFKKDCMDLPDKFYRLIELKPKPSTLRVAKAITATASTTIQGLTLLRELSDGFQYKDVKDGMNVCPLCKGEKEIERPEEIPNTCPNCKDREPEVREGQFDIGPGVHVCGDHRPQTIMTKQSCPTCGGHGEVTKYVRETVEVECPKDVALSDILDEHEDVGRLVVFAGFTGSIDRCVRLCQRAGWCVIRMDQGATKILDHQGRVIPEKDFQGMFQDDKETYPKVAFVAHPKSGGMGLTLTASPTIVYYSNTFDAEDRIQSEDRIHRAGMDVNKGATIIDLVHLPSDVKILENLQKKRDLQSLTLGEFAEALKDVGEREF